MEHNRTPYTPKGPVPLDISSQYAKALAAWGSDSLPPLDRIPTTVIDTMTRSLGKAHWRFKPNGQHTTTITLSRPWFWSIRQTAGERIMLQELEYVVLHELAHIAMYYRYQFNSDHSRQPHGIEWGRLMGKVGLPPYARIAYSMDHYIPNSNTTWGEAYNCKCSI